MKVTRFDVYLCLVVLVAAIVGAVAYLDSGQRDILKQLQQVKAAPATKPAATPPALPPMPAEVSIADSAVKGSAAAKVVMVEFSDFECPYCGRYIRDTWPKIEQAYVATGKVRYVFRHFPLESLHPAALRAGEAAECARRQDKFWPMHDQLFANQKALGPALLPTYAQAAGLDGPAFAKCLAGQALAKVKADQDNGARGGIGGTPYFFFGVPQGGDKIKVLDRIVEGAVPLARFTAILDRLLAAPAPAK